MKAAVVKLGGSTADHKEMEVWTAALAGSSLPLVIVPGGGTFADQVRDEQRRLGFSDAAAHAMAILAMDQFGHVILDRHERFSAASSPEKIEQALADGKIPVWMPSAMAISASDIPVSWDVTSDSLAAWLAGKLAADALLLVKQSRAFTRDDQVTDLMARGIVDAHFATMLPAGIGLFIAGPDAAATAAAMFSSGRLPGVHITSQTTPTPNPSPQGRGGLSGGAVERQPSTVLTERAVKGSPSPLWGGVRDGGTRQGNGQA